MIKKQIATGVFHSLPLDLRKVLLSDDQVLLIWNSLTPLARNEWICWVISVKKAETRHEHLERVPVHLKEGQRRPCCWMGCIHRKDKPMNSTQKWILDTKSKKAKSK